MKRLLLSSALAGAVVFAAGTANAGMPVFSAQCPDNHTVDADRHGTVRIDGLKAKVTQFSETAFEARNHGIAIDFGTDAGGGDLIVTYTGKHGANGVCQVIAQGSSGEGSSQGSAQGSSGSRHPVDLSDIRGMNGVNAFDEMTSRGFENVDTITSSNTIYGIYYNRSTRQCIQLTAADNSILSVDDIQTHANCR